MSETFRLFKEMVALCAGSVEISVNDHKDCHESVSEHLAGEHLDDEIHRQMAKADRVVRVTAYPDSSVGFYTVYHHDIDEAVRQCHELIIRNKNLSK